MFGDSKHLVSEEREYPMLFLLHSELDGRSDPIEMAKSS